MPLERGGGAVESEVVSAVQVAHLIEEVIYGGLDGGEFLQTSHLSKPFIPVGADRVKIITCPYTLLAFLERNPELSTVSEHNSVAAFNYRSSNGH